MSKFIEELRQLLGPQGLLVGDQVSEKYSVDWTYENPCTPEIVCRPASVVELSEVLKLCHAAGQAIVTQGGMTGLAGGATPQPGELAVSLDRLVGIEEIDLESMTITALAGTPLEVLQDAAKEAGNLLALDLGARGSCSIGGNIATNAGGNQVIRYGMARAQVLGLEAVLADGTVITSLNKMLKNNSGFDLKHLFIGSEGCLGIISRVVLRLQPLTNSVQTALCGLDNFTDVLALLRTTRTGLPGGASSFELMWASYVEYLDEHFPKLANPVDRKCAYYVLLEYQGTDEAQDYERFENMLADALEQGVVQDAVIAQSERERTSLWDIRDGIAEILPRFEHRANFDVSLPIKDMEAYVQEVIEQLNLSYSEATSLFFGHIGDSNLHLLVDAASDKERDDIYNLVYKITGNYGGAVTAEHGIGTLKRKYLQYSRSSDEIALMHTLKNALDPSNILNRGRVI